jgi:hypothetical protein
MRIRKSKRKYPPVGCPKCHADVYFTTPDYETCVVTINGHEFYAQEYTCDECGEYWVNYYKYHSTHQELLDDK